MYKMTLNVLLLVAGMFCILIGCQLLLQPVNGQYSQGSGIENEGQRTKRIYDWLFREKPSDRERMEAAHNFNKFWMARYQYRIPPYWVGSRRTSYSYNPLPFSWSLGKDKNRQQVINIRK